MQRGLTRVYRSLPCSQALTLYSSPSVFSRVSAISLQTTTRPRWLHSTRCLQQHEQNKPEESQAEDAETPTDSPEVSELKKSEASKVRMDTQLKGDPVQKQLSAAQERISTLEKENDKILRAAAELQNVQRSLQRDMARTKDFGIQKFAESLLVVADNLSMTLEKEKKLMDEPDSPAAKLYEAVVLTEKALLQAFEKHAVEKFESLGKPFDPALHDGQFEIDHPEYEPGHVGAVLSDGYKIKDRVIRPAKVGTVKKRAK